jgi:hypothetical protein
MSWICTTPDRVLLDHFKSQAAAEESWRITWGEVGTVTIVNGRVFVKDKLVGYCYLLPARDQPEHL